MDEPAYEPAVGRITKQCPDCKVDADAHFGVSLKVGRSNPAATNKAAVIRIDTQDIEATLKSVPKLDSKTIQKRYCQSLSSSIRTIVGRHRIFIAKIGSERLVPRIPEGCMLEGEWGLK